MANQWNHHVMGNRMGHLEMLQDSAACTRLSRIVENLGRKMKRRDKTLQGLQRPESLFFLSPALMHLLGAHSPILKVLERVLGSPSAVS